MAGQFACAQEADWLRLAAPRCRPGHPLALVRPARRHSGRTLVALASRQAGEGRGAGAKVAEEEGATRAGFQAVLRRPG